MTQSSQGRRPLYRIIIGVIALYWVISISMVFLNKHILSGGFGTNELTIFSAWYQCTAAVGFILGLSFANLKCGLNFFNLPKIDLHQLLSKNMLLLSISSVCALTFNNLMLKHIGVAFYQVARSFTIIFTIILSALVLRNGFSLRATFACMLVVTGFFIGIDQEDGLGTLSLFGILYGLLASLSAAVSGILFKKTEVLLEGDSLKLAYFNNINSMAMFLPLVMASGQFQDVVYSDFKYQPQFWIILTLAGCLSLAIGWVSALQIKYTSPVAHHLSINAKSVVQTVLAVLFYQETKTYLWWLGNGFVVTGVLFYAISKMQEDKGRTLNATTLPIVANGHVKPKEFEK